MKKRDAKLSHIIDDIDLKIIKTLQCDARTNFADIAKMCDISVTAIQNRYKKMIESGIIKGTLFLTEQDTEYNFSLAAELVVKINEIQNVMNEIRKLRNYVNVNRVAGKFDIHAIFHIKNLDDINIIRSNLSKINGIRSIKFIASNQIFGFFPENLFFRNPCDK